MSPEQLQVLNALDAAKTQWYHFTAIVIAGICCFTDAYDIFCILLVIKLLCRIYYYREGSADPGSLPPNVVAAVNSVAFCCTFSGQLFFGWLGDNSFGSFPYASCLVVLSKFSHTPDVEGLNLFAPVGVELDAVVEPDDGTPSCPSSRLEAVAAASMDAIFSGESP